MSELFIPNELGIEELKLSPEVGVQMEERAQAIVDRTKELAAPHRVSGAYNDKLKAVAGESDGAIVGRAIAGAVESGFLEFGTINNPTYAFLRRAVESIGLKFVGHR